MDRRERADGSETVIQGIMYAAMVSHDQSFTIKQPMPRYETDLHFANNNQEDCSWVLLYF